VQFVPGSLPARELAAERIIEMGGFVLRPDVERHEIPDILDTLALALLDLCDPRINCFWVMPRRHLMRLFWADIPEVLPPYHMALCHEVEGWNECSNRLQLLRGASFKGHHFDTHTAPYVYTISRQMIAHDFAQRMNVLYERRRNPAFAHLLNQAMHQAERLLQQEVEQLNSERGH